MEKQIECTKHVVRSYSATADAVTGFVQKFKRKKYGGNPLSPLANPKSAL